MSPHPSSWTSRWWNEQTSTRLSSSVGPPLLRHLTWWAWMNRRCPHPGNTHSRSRYFSWRSIPSEGSLFIRPSRMVCPERSSTTTWTRAVHSSPVATAGWMAGPPSISHSVSSPSRTAGWARDTSLAPSAPKPLEWIPVATTGSSNRAWMTTVARSG
jgi:hypothetical protein